MICQSRAECEECGWHGRSYRYRGSAEADATRHNMRKHPAPSPKARSQRRWTGSSGSVATRTMESGANSVNYSLYTSGTYATIWGDGTSGTSTHPHSGTGSTTTLTIYGRVPSQTTPTAATYSDTITITVTY